MNDPQNEPRTCPYCDQPRQDTFENRFRFECGTAVLKENGKTVKQSRECKLRVAYSKLLVDYCNLRHGAPSQESIDAAMADGAIVEPGDAARLQRIRERLSDCLPTGGGDLQTAREWAASKWDAMWKSPFFAWQLVMSDIIEPLADRADRAEARVRELEAAQPPAPTYLDRPNKPGWWWSWWEGEKKWVCEHVINPHWYDPCRIWLPATPPPPPSKEGAE